jgi:saccharopine dehydrogenase (NAD+, L-lysine-forming)
MTEQAILIAGGYGVVGQRIAADLAPDYPVIVAGRHLHQATATATAIGNGVRGREIDVTVEWSVAVALEDVATVVSCIDQPRRSLLHSAIERGVRYTDITPHLTELGRGAAYEEIGAAARASGARVVLGTGIVPGISNVIVRALADTLGGADAIETSLLLSASDTTGPASFDYFLKELTMPFAVHVDGTDRPRLAFSDPRLIEFPMPFGPRSAYLFPFRPGAVSAGDGCPDRFDEIGHRAREDGPVACGGGSRRRGTHPGPRACAARACQTSPRSRTDRGRPIRATG